MTWELASAAVLALALAAGFAWYERDHPPARTLALVATLAALAVVGRLAFAAIPNVKPTTDIVLFAGYALGAVPGFVVGAIAALVSNVFLSQGPWTPWQMAGWGAVGVGGALLALGRCAAGSRRAWCSPLSAASPALRSAPWMDVYQLTLAAHQDLDSYLALAATSLPYNLAHAIGNVVFCLLIGPVFIRALRRYRRRLEVSWPAPAAATLVVALLLLLPAVATAATPAGRAEAWLAKRPEQATAASAPRRARLRAASTAAGPAWAWRPPGATRATSIAAADARCAAYVKADAGTVKDIGEIERTALILESAGLSAHDFGGRDLTRAILARRRANGSIANFVSYTIFGVLALRSAGVSPGAPTVRWLVSAQNDDGGFGLTDGSPSDSDITGAALQALAVVGRRDTPVTRRAVAWLRANQNDDGGFGQSRGRDSNTQSTSYAVQGLDAAGAGGATLKRALAYLRGLQRADGSVSYSATSNQTPVWVTAQALMALERKPLPIAAVPRAPKPRKRTPKPAAAAPPEEDKGGSPSSKSAEREQQNAERGSPPAAAGLPNGPAPGDSGLRVDPAGSARGGEADSGGASPWIAIGAVAAALALLYLLRRRLWAVRSLWHSHGSDPERPV